MSQARGVLSERFVAVFAGPWGELAMNSVEVKSETSRGLETLSTKMTDSAFNGASDDRFPRHIFPDLISRTSFIPLMSKAGGILTELFLAVFTVIRS